MSIMAIQGGAQLRLQTMFLRYIEVMRQNSPPNWNDAIAVEIYHRLDRLEWLEWEVRSRDFAVRNPRLSDQQMAELMVALPTLVESWYYLAFRTMRMIKRKCPRLEAFEVMGITLTRNKLIEHDNDIYNANIAVGDGGGPEVKGPRWEGQSEDWRDVGMFANVEEFENKLRDLLMPFVITSLQGASGGQAGQLPADG